MRRMSLVLFAAVLALSPQMARSSAAVSFPLEWNPTYPTDTPYEVEILPERLTSPTGLLSHAGFAVRAISTRGEQTLDVAVLPGKEPGAKCLRFAVPPGTTGLVCEAKDDFRCASFDATTTCNLLADALPSFGQSLPPGWKLPDIQADVTREGLLLTGTASGSRYATYERDLPPAVAGRPVKLEVDVESRTPRLVWGGHLHVEQFDGTGTLLPEHVVDPRWTGHMRPPFKPTRYREEGLLHPAARKVRLVVELRGVNSSYDASGLPISDNAERTPRLLVSRLVLRPAAVLPFPKLNDRFFAPGVSGQAGDQALALDSQTAFWYQTRGMASWAQATELRDERLTFYPVEGPGTIEAWFRPDWPTFLASAHGHDGDLGRCFLFQGFQGYSVAPANGSRRGQGEVLGLSYAPNTGKLRLRLKDDANREFAGEARADIPSGRWSHVAVTWTPGDTACVWIGGARVLTVPLAGFKAPVLSDKKVKDPNDRSATELYLGSAAASSRGETRTDTPKYTDVPFFVGHVDAWRISSGVRYAAPFAPAVSFAPDADTRALFGFDRSFDGVSASGVRRISGTVRATEDTTDHLLSVNGRKLAYRPAKILPTNDPDKVFDICNYPNMPNEDDFRASRQTQRLTFDLKAGETRPFTLEGRIHPDFIEIENASDKPLVYPIVLNAGETDPRSFGDIAETLDLSGKSDRDRANAVFRFVLGASDYFRNHTVTFPPGSDEPRSVEYEALMMLNGYCGFECGPLNNMTANLFATVAGLPASQTGGYGHSFEQVFFDGKNHIYDLSAQKFIPSFDNETSAYLAESDRQPGIHYRLTGGGSGATSFLRMGTRNFWVQSPAYREKVAMTLNPGERYRVWFLNDGQVNDVHLLGPAEKKMPAALRGECAAACGADPKGRSILVVDRLFPHYGSGFLVFDGKPTAGNPAFVRLEPDSFCYAVKCCHPIVWACYRAEDAGGKSFPLEISTDGGRHFRSLPSPADYPVRARLEYLVRVKAPIASVARFRAATETQVNPRIFPGRLRTGENALTLRAMPRSAARIRAQYRRDGKPVDFEGAVFSGTIPGCERATVLLDPAKPCVLAVSGISPAAKVSVKGNIRATLQNGSLTLAAREAAAAPSIAYATVDDGGFEKTLTVVVCSGARLLPAAAGKIEGAGSRKGRPFGGPQDCAVLAENGRVALSCPDMPAGQYALMTLGRFAGRLSANYPIHFVLPGTKQLVKCATPNSLETEFLKAPYGRAGGRANFKWEYPPVRESYPYKDMRTFPMSPTTDMLVFSNEGAEPYELAAVLLMPTPTREFRRELVKVLCGLNGAAERVTPW